MLGKKIITKFINLINTFDVLLKYFLLISTKNVVNLLDPDGTHLMPIHQKANIVE